jgi:hypothetical protein
MSQLQRIIMSVVVTFDIRSHMESNLGNIPSLNMFQINDRAKLDRSEKVATFAANFH